MAVVGEAVDQHSVIPRDAAPECVPPHRLRPSLGVRAGERDLVVSGSDQSRDRVEDLLELGRGRGRRFVPASFRLSSEVTDDRFERRSGGEGGSRVVEVRDVRTARSRGAFGLHVDLPVHALGG